MLDHAGSVPPSPMASDAVARRGRADRHASDCINKSATRALEVLELFAICREALSVSAVADALAIPQSSASILLKAVHQAGFIERDAQTRKYLPSLRSTLAAHRVSDCFLAQTDLLATLDQVSRRTGCGVRLGVRRGIHVQYAHVAWPDENTDRLLLRPGALRSICHDALGTMLLAAGSDEAARATIRHVNAVAGPELDYIRPSDYIGRLRRCRERGFSEEDAAADGAIRVLAVGLAVPPGSAAASVGVFAPADLLARHGATLLRTLGEEVAGVRLAAPAN